MSCLALQGTGEPIQRLGTCYALETTRHSTHRTAKPDCHACRLRLNGSFTHYQQQHTGRWRHKGSSPAPAASAVGGGKGTGQPGYQHGYDDPAAAEAAHDLQPEYEAPQSEQEQARRLRLQYERGHCYGCGVQLQTTDPEVGAGLAEHVVRFFPNACCVYGLPGMHVSEKKSHSGLHSVMCLPSGLGRHLVPSALGATSWHLVPSALGAHKLPGMHAARRWRATLSGSGMS